MSIDSIAKVVGIVVGPILAIIAVRREIRESQKPENSQELSPSTGKQERWPLFRFVLSVASISFFTTIATQYVYPPYAIWAPMNYKPIFSHSTIILLWLVGLGLLVFLSGIPKTAMEAWGKSNIREKVAQSIVIGIALLMGAILIAATIAAISTSN